MQDNFLCGSSSWLLSAELVFIDQKAYRSMIGSLFYLCASRPDIMLSVGICAWFQATPKEIHYVAVKRIFQYLAHAPNFSLWYPRGANFNLVGFSDSDWAGSKWIGSQLTEGANFLVALW